MTPPDETPSNPYDPNWPKPEQPYGQAPYGAPGYTPTYGGGAMLAPKHPSATTALVLGLVALVGMFLCGLPILLAPIAWITGGKAVKEIDAHPGQFSGREQAQAGRIMGIVGTVLLGLAIIGFIGAIALFSTSDFSSDSEDTTYNSDPSF